MRAAKSGQRRASLVTWRMLAVASLMSGGLVAAKASAADVPYKSPEPEAMELESTPSTPTRAAAPVAAASAPAAATAAEPTGVATVPPTTATEKQAAKLSAEALGPLLRSRQLKLGELRLREAIRICGPEVCSTAFSARLHRDLGYLYVDALKRVDDGKDEFTVALSLDSTVILAEPMLSLAVTESFADVKKAVVKPAPVETPQPTEPAGEPDAEAKPESPGDPLLNWFSLSLQGDMVIRSGASPVCNGLSGSYRCYGENNLWEPGFDKDGNPRFEAGSNQLDGTKVNLGTTRILLGYDRVVAHPITVGVRLGMLLSGKPLRHPSDSAVMSFHGELRAAYWFGDQPFAHRGWHPYVFLAAGLGETASKTTMQLVSLESGEAQSLTVWKRSGHTFIGPGVGVRGVLTKNSGPLAELRLMQFMAPSMPAVSLVLGYAMGI